MEVHSQRLRPNIISQRQSNASLNQDRVLNFIISTFQFILDEIKKRPYGCPQICLQRLVSVEVSREEDTDTTEWKLSNREVVYGWPGKNANEAWRFACVSRILVEIHKAITTGVTVTKRDIYYHDPILFKRQEVVDRYIDDIALTCDVTRKDLNVTASPKGLVIGLKPYSNIVNSIQDSIDEEELLPIDHVKWILVVEKEATFHTLADLAFHRSSATASGLILTAKGYPDLATHRFLRILVDRLGCHIPLYGLFDADPDGLDILRCYSLGSRVTAPEKHFRRLDIRWLGVKLCDVGGEACTSLTMRDRVKARSMLSRRHLCAPCLQSQEYRHTLQVMLMLNMKAEIQGIENSPGRFVEWLMQKISLAEF